MNPKILLFALTAAAFSSCSTAYKSGQTPDDVYYSPVRAFEEKTQEKTKPDEVKYTQPTNEDRQIRWGIRDRRWRDLDYDYDYDYSYNKSPYGYCSCTCNNQGYYYNPRFSPWPIYSTRVIPAQINTTPRMVNLGTYKGYNNAVNTNPKGGNGTIWVKPERQYNNSNNRSGFGNVVRQIFTPGSNSNSNPSSNNSNSTRTYSPSSSTNSSSGSNNSSGSSNSSGTSVPRPPRGGK